MGIDGILVGADGWGMLRARYQSLQLISILLNGVVVHIRPTLRLV